MITIEYPRGKREERLEYKTINNIGQNASETDKFIYNHSFKIFFKVLYNINDDLLV